MPSTTPENRGGLRRFPGLHPCSWCSGRRGPEFCLSINLALRQRARCLPTSHGHVFSVDTPVNLCFDVYAVLLRRERLASGLIGFRAFGVGGRRRKGAGCHGAEPVLVSPPAGADPALVPAGERRLLGVLACPWARAPFGGKVLLVGTGFASRKCERRESSCGERRLDPWATGDRWRRRSWWWTTNSM
jgi:hypothetical protein